MPPFSSSALESIRDTQSYLRVNEATTRRVLDAFPRQARRRVLIGGLGFDPLAEHAVVGHVREELRQGRGGWILTANVDILRSITRDASTRRLAAEANLIVADGAPLLWMARLLGQSLPGRVAGSSLLWSLCGTAAREDRSIFLLGGERGVADRAAERLRRHNPGLRVAGTHSPPFGFEADPAAVEDVRQRLMSARPDIIFVGLGFPKQERLIAGLLPSIPGAWWLGCGAAIPFAAGTLRRAPAWVQSMGMEWAHRLVCEPRRLFRRYVINDLPFAVRMLAASAGTGLVGSVQSRQAGWSSCRTETVRD